MSQRHFILDNMQLRLEPDFALQDAIDLLVAEHQNATQSIEERCARAEALAILAIELLRRANNA